MPLPPSPTRPKPSPLPAGKPVFVTSAVGHPSSVVVGSNVTMTVTVAITQGALPDGLVDIEIYYSGGSQAFQKFLDHEAFPAGTKRTYLFTFVPVVIDTYTVKVGIFSAGWCIKYDWNDRAGSITATSLFTSSAVVSLTSLTVGVAVSATVRVDLKTGNVTNGIIDFEVYDGNGHVTHQEFIEGQTFSALTTWSHTWSWAVAAAGAYTVKVGIFNGDWSVLYDWNNDAADFTVSPAPGTPTFISSAVATPSKVAVRATVTIAVAVTITHGALPDGIIDLEIYDAGGSQVYQQYLDGQNFQQGFKLTRTWKWVPDKAATFIIKIGIFSGDWNMNFDWNDQAAVVTVV